MISLACFCCIINFRVISEGFSLFYSFSIFFTLNFAIPLSNVFILWFSSVPIQAAQIFPKIGSFLNTIEGLSQSFCRGFLFIISQCKEFLYSYFSLSDCIERIA